MKTRNLVLSVLAGAMLFGSATVSCGNGGSRELTIVHFDQTILGERGKELGVSIGISKSNSELETLLNGALATITEETRQAWMAQAIARADGDASTSAANIEVTYDATRPTLTIGLECDYAPFNWTETSQTTYSYAIKGVNGQYCDGYDVYVGKYLANAINYNLEFVKMDWDSLIPALETGTVNAVIAGMTDTEQRRQSISFTNEYFRSELVLVVKADSSLANATSLEAFKGKKIGSQIETVTDDVIEDWVTQFGVKHVNAMDTFSTCAMAVQNGTIHAMTAELPVAQAIVNGSK